MIEVLMAHLNWVIVIVAFCIPLPYYWVIFDDIIAERKERRQQKNAPSPDIAAMPRNDSIY